MTSKRFRVEVISRQRALYHIEAQDARAAEHLAVQRWQTGDPSDLTGFEVGELIAVHSNEAPDALRQAQDDELVLRYIRERERLLTRLAGDLLAASPNDAMAATQVAADLGWLRLPAQDGAPADAARAAEALERLCAAKHLVCFERDRVRAGERGSIRLYCTPEYLERLTSVMHESTHGSASA